jgi:hypothetical protein
MRAGEAIRARIAGRKADPLSLDYPTVHDGVAGMKFIEAVVKSKGRWVKIN